MRRKSSQPVADSITKLKVPKRYPSSALAWSLIWALALIGSSFFLKGFAIGEWVDSFLYLIAGVCGTTYMLHHRFSRMCS